MLHLMRGELYRLLRKKSMYVYFGVVLAGYFLLAFVRSGGFGESSVLNDGMTLFNFMPALAGGFFFSAIYTDDLNAKNLVSLVGYGLRKTEIVAAKLILTLPACAVFFGLLPLFHGGVYALLAHGATANQAASLFLISFKFFLLSVAYSVVSGIVVYGWQRSTFAVVTYFLLAFGIVDGLLSILSNALKIKLLPEHLLSGLADRIVQGIAVGSAPVFPIAEMAVYVLIAAVISVIVFHKKEMEF